MGRQKKTKMNTLTSENSNNSEQDNELEVSNEKLDELNKEIDEILSGKQQKKHFKPVNEIKGIKAKIADKFLPHKTFLINMELNNGMHTTFTIVTSKKVFKYQGATYVIDSSLKYYKINSKIYALDYHQSFALPIKREIPITDVKRAIEAGTCEVENSTNPLSLTKILEAKVGEGIANSSQIPDFIKQIRLLLIVGTVSSVTMLVLFIFKSGMLNQVKVW